MNMALSALVSLGLVFVLGCASTGKNINKLQIGMDETEVSEILGEPDTTKGRMNEKILVYDECASRRMGFGVCNERKEYWVTIVDGKVKSFGLAGDFETDNKMKVILEQSTGRTR